MLGRVTQVAVFTALCLIESAYLRPEERPAEGVTSDKCLLQSLQVHVHMHEGSTSFHVFLASMRTELRSRMAESDLRSRQSQ